MKGNGEKLSEAGKHKYPIMPGRAGKSAALPFLSRCVLCAVITPYHYLCEDGAVNVTFTRNQKGETPTMRGWGNQTRVCLRAERSAPTNLHDFCLAPRKVAFCSALNVNWSEQTRVPSRLECRVHYMLCQTVLTNVPTPSNLLSI